MVGEWVEREGREVGVGEGKESRSPNCKILPVTLGIVNYVHVVGRLYDWLYKDYHPFDALP
jgi:hypothetical protein